MNLKNNNKNRWIIKKNKPRKQQNIKKFQKKLEKQKQDYTISS